jgi:hypothetical protein
MVEEASQVQRLGWIAFDDGQQLEDGRWCVLIMRDPRETILAFAGSREEAWSAACSMAARLSSE